MSGISEVPPITGADLRDGLVPGFGESADYIEEMLADYGLSWEHVAHQVRVEFRRQIMQESLPVDARVATASAFGYLAALLDVDGTSLRREQLGAPDV